MKRYRGDTYPTEVTLKRNGSPLNLDLISSAEFSITKSGTIITKTCQKNADPLTGKIEIEMTSDIVDDVGSFCYDIQVIWAANGTRQTVTKDIITFAMDVNKT